MSTINPLETTALEAEKEVAPCLLKDQAMLIDGHKGKQREILYQQWRPCYDCPRPDPVCPGYRPKP